MSLHVSHLPTDKKLNRIDIHGMNRDELLANEARIQTNRSCFVIDLNKSLSFLRIGATGEYNASNLAPAWRLSLSPIDYFTKRH